MVTATTSSACFRSFNLTASCQSTLKTFSKEYTLEYQSLQNLQVHKCLDMQTLHTVLHVSVKAAHLHSYLTEGIQAHLYVSHVYARLQQKLIVRVNIEVRVHRAARA